MSSHSSVCASVKVREGEPTERECRIAEYIRKVHEDYDGKVLCEEAPPDPPVRGPYGYVYIPLKEGAEPQRQKPFYQHGERFDAMKKSPTVGFRKSSSKGPRLQLSGFAKVLRSPKIRDFSLEGGS